ncbi:MAG: sensor histidine kinase [Christensenellales bacterium]|jgi:signal transduction histidine kinase
MMAEFYTWAEAARLFITFLIALAVLAQALAVVLSFHRHTSSFGHYVENILELFVLTQILVCSLLYGQLIYSYYNSLIVPMGYGVLRIVCFAAVALMALVVAVTNKKTGTLLVALVSALMLPMVEPALGNVFAYCYLAAMMFYLVRGIYVCILRYREIKVSLSALSIKHAIDSLHTGVLYSGMDGFILLINAQMQTLMKEIFDRIHRNGNHFYEWLAEGEMQPGCERAGFQGKIVCLLPDKTAWMFTKTELQIKRKRYIQLTATDITERWVLTEQLQQREFQLKTKGEELNRSIINLHILSRERETQRAKMRAHDVLGQRMTLLLRTIRSEQALDYDLLRSLSQGLLDDLKADKNMPSPQDELDGLQQAFGSIGVDIKLNGTLPKDHIKGRMMTDIIRESVANAVRHGFATKIRVKIDFLPSGYHLEITNNGYLPSEPIVEGGGISSMRKMAESCGGELDVSTHPSFVLTVHLPGGEAHVQGAYH